MSTDDIDFLDALEPDPPVKSKADPVQAVTIPSVSPRVRGCLEIAAVVIVTVVFSVGLTTWWLGGRGDAPGPGDDFDPHFIAVGKAYLGDLGKAYGSAWEDGAKVLDAGQTVDMAIDTTAKAWESNRKAAFNQRVTPELSKIVEQGKDAASVTSEDRAALAKAYRGLAKGLESR